MYFHTGQVLIMENRVPPADGAGGRRGSGRRLELYINRKKNVQFGQFVECPAPTGWRLETGAPGSPIPKWGLLCHLAVELGRQQVSEIGAAPVGGQDSFLGPYLASTTTQLGPSKIS